MNPGDTVKCGMVNMGRYQHGAGWQERWFTGREGRLKHKADGVHPPSWFVVVGDDELLLSDEEFEVVQ